MLRWAGFALPAAFLAQALIVNMPGAAERLPAMPDLSRFPKTLPMSLPATSGNWDLVAEEKIDPAVEGQLGADQVFSRTYRQSGLAPVGEGGLVNLFVAWFQSQRGGRTQPHSPKVCLPGAGWTPEESGEIRIQTTAESIPANRFVVTSNLGQHAVVLYWYQTPRRVLAGEWESKFWLIPDAIRDHRTDTALVRLVIWTGKGHEAEATKTGVEFARSSYPVLRQVLPR
jgi:EpsI family protein